MHVLASKEFHDADTVLHVSVQNIRKEAILAEALCGQALLNTLIIEVDFWLCFLFLTLTQVVGEDQNLVVVPIRNTDNLAGVASLDFSLLWLGIRQLPHVKADVLLL